MIVVKIAGHLLLGLFDARQPRSGPLQIAAQGFDNDLLRAKAGFVDG